ncbi:MAG: hypothetical protein WBE48_02115 [Xanthobacteraceae bacterium]
MRSQKASTFHRQPEREDRLTVARALYKSLVAYYPDKSIMLYDDCGLMMAHTDDNRDPPTGALPSEQ